MESQYHGCSLVHAFGKFSEPGLYLSANPKVAEGSNDGILQTLDKSSSPNPQASQVYNRVCDKLSRAVEGCLSSSPDFYNPSSKLSELLYGRVEILGSATLPHGICGWMLHLVSIRQSAVESTR